MAYTSRAFQIPDVGPSNFVRTTIPTTTPPITQAGMVYLSTSSNVPPYTGFGSTPPTDFPLGSMSMAGIHMPVHQFAPVT